MKLYIPDGYRVVNVSGRLLQVPKAADRKKQREIYEEVKAVRPLSFKPEAIQASIRESFQKNPGWKALRTDIKSCFATIPQNILRREIQGLPLSPELQQSLINVYTPVERGVPTGSPLSPWLAELVLSQVDAAMQGHNYFRYADDICVLGPESTCVEAGQKLREVLEGLGMQINEAKTRIVAQPELVFLGRSYRELEDSQMLQVNLGGDSFDLPNGKHVFFRVNATGKPYAEPDGNPTYSLSCLLNRMLSQPTPYILEMLMLRPACEEPSLARIIEAPDSIIDRRSPDALHGKIYRHYKNQVRDPLDRSGKIPIGPAGEVFRWLHLTNTLMKTGKLPDNYRAVEENWLELMVSLEAGEYEPYHKRIKELFKLEYQLRRGPRDHLPPIKAAIEMSVD